jgi:hypothetical protein
MSESQIRELRDRVYGCRITDQEWESCKHRWMKPDQIEWLQAQKQYDQV